MKNLVKKALALFLAVGILGGVSSVFAKDMAQKDFREVPVKEAQMLQTGDAKDYCPVCGMVLHKFYKTNHAAKVNGKEHQYCSINCMIEESYKTDVTDPKVVDVTSLKFIDAAKAFYVYGSSKPATMAKISTYAFATEADAKKFAKEFGGEVLTFAEVSKKTKDGLKADMEMVNKKQIAAAEKGKKLYEKSCSKIDNKFSSPAQAKAFLKKNATCGELSDMELSQIAHYLFRR